MRFALLTWNQWFQIYYQYARKKNIGTIFDAEHDKLYIFKGAKSNQIFVIGHFKFFSTRRKVDLTEYYNWKNVQIIER